MATQTLPLSSPAPGRTAQTLIPRIDADPRIVAFAQTTREKLAMLASAAVLFYFRGVRDPVVTIVLAGIFFFPRHAWALMAISGIYWIPSMIKGGFGLEQRIIAMTLAVGVAVLLWTIVHLWPKGLVGRSPRLALLGAFAAAVGAALLAPVGAISQVLWSLVAALAACLWIFSFALTDRTDTALWPNAAMFFSFFPAALASTTPFFKRPSAMRRMEAKNAEERAVVQLKGLKLSGLEFSAFASLGDSRYSLGSHWHSEIAGRDRGQHGASCARLVSVLGESPQRLCGFRFAHRDLGKHRGCRLPPGRF